MRVHLRALALNLFSNSLFKVNFLYFLLNTGLSSTFRQTKERGKRNGTTKVMETPLESTDLASRERAAAWSLGSLLPKHSELHAERSAMALVCSRLSLNNVPSLPMGMR